jgi:hypothetical protein
MKIDSEFQKNEIEAAAVATIIPVLGKNRTMPGKLSARRHKSFIDNGFRAIG